MDKAKVKTDKVYNKGIQNKTYFDMEQNWLQFKIERNAVVKIKSG